jgi:hypothetical protein
MTPPDSPPVRGSVPPSWWRQRLAHGFALAAVACALAVVACERASVDATPQRAVEAFVERMERVHGDPAIAQSALALLSTSTRRALDERAERATAVAGHAFEPADMLVPSYFLLEYTPRRYVAKTEGDTAEVSVIGDDPATETRVVRCVKEAGAWRIVLDLPALHPIKKR